MLGSTPPSPVGSLILIGILLFIVYRILSSLSGQQKAAKTGESVSGKIFRLPTKKPAAPPASARLTPITGDKDPFGQSAEALDFHKTLMDKGGLERIGDYFIEEMPGYALRAFTHPSQSFVAIIYKDPGDRVWVNLVTEYEDGRIITSSSAESGAISLSRPHGMPLFNYPGLSVEQLLRRHKLETRGTKQAEPIPPEKFPEYFAKNYAKVRAHVYEQEQRKTEMEGTGSILSLPQNQPQDVYAKQPVNEDMGEDEFIPSRADHKEWLDIIYRAVEVPKDKRGQFQSGLVWIIDNATAQSISQTISDYSGVTVDQAEGRLIIRTEAGPEDIIEPGELKGPELFEKINSGLPAGSRFTRLPVDIKGVAFYSTMSLKEL